MEPKEESDEMTDGVLDASGIPTPVCPNCGSDWFMAPIRICPDTYAIVMWGVKGFCYSCKTKVTIGTPSDVILYMSEGETDD